MGKRKGAADEAGPSRLARSGKKKVAATSEGLEVETRSGREMDPQVPRDRTLLAEYSHGKFHNRRVLFEAHVNAKLFKVFPLFERLEAAGWGPVFEGTTRANVGTVRAFYSRIYEPTLEPLQFKIPAGRGLEATVDVALIAHLMRMPLSEVHASERNLNNENEKDRRTRFLCGQLVQWQSNRSLLASDMKDDFQLLHHVFTFNVYPRWGNRSECTRLMVDFLYQVGQEAKICVPTYVLRQIILTARSTRKTDTLPFGRLICNIAREIGYKLGTEAIAPQYLIDEQTLKRMKIGPRYRPEEETSGEEYESDESGYQIEEEQERGEEETPDAGESTPPTVPELGTDRARLARLEEGLAVLRQEQAAQRQDIMDLKALVKHKFQKVARTLKTILCCVQDKNAPTPSPDSDA